MAGKHMETQKALPALRGYLDMQNTKTGFASYASFSVTDLFAHVDSLAQEDLDTSDFGSRLVMLQSAGLACAWLDDDVS